MYELKLAGTARNLSERERLHVIRLSQMVVVFVLASSKVAITFLGVIPSIMRLWRPLGWVLVSTPTIVALLLGMWSANLGRTSRPIAT
jgi:hypothetical protein